MLHAPTPLGAQEGSLWSPSGHGMYHNFFRSEIMLSRDLLAFLLPSARRPQLWPGVSTWLPNMVEYIQDTSTHRVHLECRVRHRNDGCKKESAHDSHDIVTILPKRRGRGRIVLEWALRGYVARCEMKDTTTKVASDTRARGKTCNVKEPLALSRKGRKKNIEQ